MAAAESLLRERPFRELTVDEVMRRTDLSRPSFYVYFRDRHHLVLRVVEHLGVGAAARCPSAGYTGTGDGPTLAREALRGHRRGRTPSTAPVLRALADAATRRPRGRAGRTARLVQTFVDVTARHIERGDRAPDASSRSTRDETAKALVWMMERYLNRSASAASR